MTKSQILKARLQNTGLGDSHFKSAAEAVAHLGAVQAQEFTSAKWGLGLRIASSTDRAIEEEYNAGTILRTHILRPTWHFVTPENIRWMLDLTAPRIKRTLESYNLKMGLDSKVLAKTNRAIVRALERTPYLTRKELKTILEKIGIQTDVQRLAHIMVAAELEGLICSGPARGKQLTYALLDTRAPKSHPMTREEAIAKLSRIYLASHGPAQLKDFSWWCGVPAKEAEIVMNSHRGQFESIDHDQKTYWFVPLEKNIVSTVTGPFLLSIYDEYTIAYTDRKGLSLATDIEKMVAMGSALTSVMILNGRVAGTWRKKLTKNKLQISISPFRPLTLRERRLLDTHIRRYAQFLDIKEWFSSIESPNM